MSPSWLWGIGAILVPIAIHFLSRGSSPRLPLGTIRFLERSSSRTARRLKLTEPMLLVLRCAALGLFALILAEPLRWLAPEPSAGEGRLFVDPVLLAEEEVAADLEALVTERRAAGWDVLILEPGLPELTEATVSSVEQTTDLWSLAREAVWRSPPGAKVEFVTSDRLSALRGARPRLPDSVSWSVLPASGPERVSRWVAGAWISASSGTEVILGSSTIAGTRFDRARAGEFSTIGGAVSLNRRDAEAVPAGRSRPHAPVSGRAVRVAVVYDTDRELDAGYVLAALEALSAAVPFGLEMETPKPSALEDSRYDVLFWLSPAPPSAAARSSVMAGGTLVADGGALREECAGWVEVRGLRFETWRCSETVKLDDSFGRIWTVGGERTLLASTRSSARTEFALASRFRPDWTGLVGSPVLLEWLTEVLVDTAADRDLVHSSDNGRDLSALAPEFIAPAAVSVPFARQSRADKTLASLLWALLAVTLTAERLLAYRFRGATRERGGGT